MLFRYQHHLKTTKFIIVMDVYSAEAYINSTEIIIMKILIFIVFGDPT